MRDILKLPLEFNVQVVLIYHVYEINYVFHISYSVKYWQPSGQNILDNLGNFLRLS